MAEPKRIPERQLDLGAAAFFRVLTETPPGAQVVVQAGFAYQPGRAVRDRFTAGNQTTASFATVTVGNQRYDLVYLNETGAATILQGTAVVLGSPAFNGAPGFSGGPILPGTGIPIAYVFVDEDATVVVDQEDITQLGGQFPVMRDFMGALVDKGLLGAAPTGGDDVVTTLFAGETPGAGQTVAGVITTAPYNLVRLADQNRAALYHITAPESEIFGRLTHAAGVWTLSYFYVNAAGVETAVANIATETQNSAPTDLRLAQVPKVFSRHDSNFPLFMRDSLAELTAARRTGVTARRNSGTATPRRRDVNFIESGGITITVVDDPTNEEIEVTISSAGGFPGFGGTPPADGGAGSAGAAGTASRSDHQHPFNNGYRTSFGFASGAGGAFNPVAAAVGSGTARAAVLFCYHNGLTNSFGAAVQGGGQGCIIVGAGGSANIADNTAGTIYQAAFATTTCTVTRIAGADTIASYALLVIGDAT